ncbi:MAG: FecR family protein [Bacteroidales bacterium]
MNQNQENIDEYLLLQYLLGKADEKLSAQIQEWLLADSRNSEQLDQLESLWVESGKLSPVPVVVDVEAAWQRMSNRIDVVAATDHSSYKATKVRPLTMYHYLAGIAALLFLIIGSYIIFRLVNPPVNQVELASKQEIVHNTLPDGSRVTLNKNSKLLYPMEFGMENRDVSLTGEAFFEVHHDKAHPFIVKAGEASVKVLGTSFSVKNVHDGAVSVNVSEGHVMFFTIDKRSGDTVSIVLEAGESGILRKGQQRPERITEPSADTHYWANNTLDFRRTPLSEVFSLLNKYYGVEVSVSESEIMNCKLTASFTDEPAERILKVISESFNLMLEGSGSKYHLTGHGCTNENN